MIGYVAAAAAGVVVGFALGLTHLVNSGHECRTEGCYALVGSEHNDCVGHRYRYE